MRVKDTFLRFGSALLIGFFCLMLGLFAIDFIALVFMVLKFYFLPIIIIIVLSLLIGYFLMWNGEY